MQPIDITEFIGKYVTKREQSMFLADIDTYKDELSEKIGDKSLLVIGGAGTIGSSFIKAALNFKPRQLIVIDNNENGLTSLTRELRSSPCQYTPKNYLTYPMNFGDAVFRKFFLDNGPFDIVANFAAHKHVRSEKDIYSIEAMINNNVFKAKNLLDLLEESPPNHFFCVSTDKAANPVNVMGATKKLMEEVIMAYCDNIHVTTARFANVAFSNGSLLDGYMERFRRKQALSCPSNIRRFFVSPEESGQLCMLACMLGNSGDIFFPKLHNDSLVSFKEITEELVRSMQLSVHPCTSEQEARKISQSRRTTDGGYPVYFFESETSGEKQYEEFHTNKDEIDLKKFDGLGVITNSKKPTKGHVDNVILDLENLLEEKDRNKEDVVDLLQRFLPNFNHQETGLNLDAKM